MNAARGSFVNPILVMRLWHALVLAPALCLGQSSVRTGKTEVRQKAWIRGTVISDTTSQPLNRARVFLKSASGESPNVAVDADDKGAFVIPDVIPGKYSISAQRDGYLPGAIARREGARLPAVMTVEAGQTLNSVTI